MNAKWAEGQGLAMLLRGMAVLDWDDPALLEALLRHLCACHPSAFSPQGVANIVWSLVVLRRDSPPPGEEPPPGPEPEAPFGGGPAWALFPAAGRAGPNPQGSDRVGGFELGLVSWVLQALDLTIHGMGQAELTQVHSQLFDQCTGTQSSARCTGPYTAWAPQVHWTIHGTGPYAALDHAEVTQVHSQVVTGPYTPWATHRTWHSGPSLNPSPSHLNPTLSHRAPLLHLSPMCLLHLTKVERKPTHWQVTHWQVTHW